MNPLLHAKVIIKSLFPFLPAVLEFRRRFRTGSFPIYLDYPITPLPRYGWGTTPHELLYALINTNRDAYAALIANFASFKSGLSSISPKPSNDASSPYWSNGWMMGLDVPSLFKSNLYVEIGSGNSTKFVKKSIKDNLLETKIISIDPHPRVEIDSLCDNLIRSPLENIDVNIFDKLNDGDILMIDNSHRCFQNSDVTTVFLDILPRLKNGVIIYIDDIYVPWDYPPEWASRYYSEQYLLAVLLLVDAQRRYEILFPGWFISTDSELRKIAEDVWKEIGIGKHNQIEGNGFWMRVKTA
jgi:hypothetical protein